MSIPNSLTSFFCPFQSMKRLSMMSNKFLTFQLQRPATFHHRSKEKKKILNYFLLQKISATFCQSSLFLSFFLLLLSAISFFLLTLFHFISSCRCVSFFQTCVPLMVFKKSLQKIPKVFFANENQNRMMVILFIDGNLFQRPAAEKYYTTFTWEFSKKKL